MSYDHIRNWNSEVRAWQQVPVFFCALWETLFKGWERKKVWGRRINCMLFFFSFIRIFGWWIKGQSGLRAWTQGVRMNFSAVNTCWISQHIKSRQERAPWQHGLSRIVVILAPHCRQSSLKWCHSWQSWKYASKQCNLRINEDRIIWKLKKAKQRTRSPINREEELVQNPHYVGIQKLPLLTRWWWNTLQIFWLELYGLFRQLMAVTFEANRTLNIIHNSKYTNTIVILHPSVILHPLADLHPYFRLDILIKVGAPHKV